MADWEGEVSTGLLDDADVTIENGYFGTDASYQSGDALIWILEGESPDSDEPVRQFYSIGKGWETSDNGETVEGKDKFNVLSNYYMFFRAALDCDGVQEIVEDRANDPAVGNLWNGMTFHMERQEIIPENDNIKPWHVLLPVSFLGVAGGEKKGKSKSKAKDKDKTKVKAKSSDDDDDTKKAAKVLRGKIRKLAKEADDHDEFLDAVHDQFPEVTDHEALYNKVLDEDDLFAKAQE